ncbi:MAG TPA: YggS family pyridoxal phosphate-dependent enzyme, partial [Chlamydiales bacterium]|nr:YggS family pyridoxal phosphate-dependent enzyme [Chlamydiales bacterium]
ALYQLGLRNFAENRLQEAQEKQALLPKDILWHFIGSIQTNKIRKLIGSFYLIHSIENFSPLAEKIDLASYERGITTDVLLEVNTSQELTKHGMTREILLAEFPVFLSCKHIRVRGLMTMASQYMPNDLENEPKARHCFQELRKLKEILIQRHPEAEEHFTQLSMGMSQDFEIAIEEGATIVRIGSALFV